MSSATSAGARCSRCCSRCRTRRREPAAPVCRACRCASSTARRRRRASTWSCTSSRPPPACAVASSTTPTCSTPRPLRLWAATSCCCWRRSWRRRPHACRHYRCSRTASASAWWSSGTPPIARAWTRARCTRSWPEQVERSPDAIAVRDNAEELTYAELERRANQLAHELIARGVGVDGRVAIMLTRSASVVVALYAVLKTGAALRADGSDLAARAAGSHVR